MMNSSEVVEKVRFFRAARTSIRENRHLSEEGMKRQLENLKMSEEKFHSDAVFWLKQAWKTTKKDYSNWQAKKKELEKAEGERWNYEALNYESQAFKARIRSMRDLNELENYLEGVLEGGNREKARVAAEIAPGFIRERFPGVDGQLSANHIEKRLPEILTTPELERLNVEEDLLAKKTIELFNQTTEVQNFYNQAGIFSGSSEWAEMKSGVKISETYVPENFVFRTNVVFEDVELEEEPVK